MLVALNSLVSFCLFHFIAVQRLPVVTPIPDGKCIRWPCLLTNTIGKVIWNCTHCFVYTCAYILLLVNLLHTSAWLYILVQDCMNTKSSVKYVNSSYNSLHNCHSYFNTFVTTGICLRLPRCDGVIARIVNIIMILVLSQKHHLKSCLWRTLQLSVVTMWLHS